MALTAAPRAVQAGDHAALLALNNAHAVELSWQAAAAFSALLDDAWHARTVGDADALLIALDQHAHYSNPNFAWFAARHAHFVYIDRIVVAAHARGGGLAALLYAGLIERARATGHTRLCCEINHLPPNPASQAFHARLGFVVVGRATLDGGKQVDYLELAL